MNILSKLFDSICSDLNVLPEAAKSRCRKKELVLARQIFCYWAHDSELFTLYTIASAIPFDHSTVVASLKKVNKEYRKNDLRYVDAISKTAENAELILEKYKRPSTDTRVLRLLGLLEMLDYSQCSQTTVHRTKKILTKILMIKQNEEIKQFSEKN